MIIFKMEGLDIVGSIGKIMLFISNSIHEQLRKRRNVIDQSENIDQVNQKRDHVSDLTNHNDILRHNHSDILHHNHNDEEYQTMKRNVDVWTCRFSNNEEIIERLKGIHLAANLYEYACIKDGIRVLPGTCYNLRRDYFDIYMHTERYIENQ
jgi:hypothetical protein